MRSCFRFLLLPALLLPSALAGQSARGEVSRETLRAHLHALAHDSMLGRDAGRVGNVRATDYIARELRRLGVRPAGEDGTYFQSIPLVERTLDPSSTLRVDGGPPLAMEADFLPLRTVGLTFLGERFRGEAVPVVFGGRVGGELIPPEQARGKVVVLLPAAPTANAQLPLGASAAPIAAYGGAAAVAVAGKELATPAQLAFLHQPFASLSDPASPYPGVPALLVTTAAAERMLGAPPAGLRPGAAGKTLSGSAGFREAPTPFPARNVVGIVPGTDPALRGQYVAVGAHSDHVGVAPVPLDHDSVRAFNAVVRPLGANDPPREATAEEAVRIRAALDSLRRVRPARRDSVFNGADDDASGSAVELALAEHFARSPARRSILLVWHTAEEKGLFGAQYFTDHPTVPRDSIVAEVNMDQVSRGGPADVPGSRADALFLLGSRRLSTELGDLVERVNAARPRPFALDYALDAPGHPAMGYCRSDHYLYARYGIPIVFFSAGWHRDYHMVTDEAQYVRPWHHAAGGGPRPRRGGRGGGSGPPPRGGRPAPRPRHSLPPVKIYGTKKRCRVDTLPWLSRRAPEHGGSRNRRHPEDPMSHRNRRLLRTLFAVPSAAVLVFGATQALASPPAAARPSCVGYCEENLDLCIANPSDFMCRYCGCYVP